MCVYHYLENQLMDEHMQSYLCHYKLITRLTSVEKMLNGFLRDVLLLKINYCETMRQ